MKLRLRRPHTKTPDKFFHNFVVARQYAKIHYDVVKWTNAHLGVNDKGVVVATLHLVSMSEEQKK